MGMIKNENEAREVLENLRTTLMRLLKGSSAASQGKGQVELREIYKYLLRPTAANAANRAATVLP